MKHLDESPTTANPAEGQELATERATLMTLLDAVIAEPLSFSPSAMVGIFVKARDVLSADYDYSALRTRPTEPVAGSGVADEAGCVCQHCNQRFKMDLLVPDDLWESIRRGMNLLCPACIVERIERRLGFSAFRLSDLSVRRPATDDLVEVVARELSELRDFLNGEAEIKGEHVQGWFGERHKAGRFLSAAFWWRPEMKRRLNKAIAAIQSIGPRTLPEDGK